MEYKGYTKQWERDLSLLNIRATLYVHDKTGAEIMHFQNDDNDKAFGIGFRTLPQDSTGIPHILEHSVLAGSKKYPTKEPFAYLLKSSLKTFVNAFTYPDKTIYPIASQNDEDLKNLMNVYLDAVFNPLLTPETFAQEGWHLEYDKEKKQLLYKGVVYNEMKGAYSNTDSVVYEYLQQGLYPDTIYKHDSGGNPEVIPQLTYEQFKRFYAENYHPSNAKIYFYGDLELGKYLPLLDKYLNNYEKKIVISEIEPQKYFDKLRVIERTIPVSEDKAENGGIAFNAWLIGDGKNNGVLTPKDRLGWSILAYLLLSSDASVFKKALLNSGLGESIFGGLEYDVLQPCLTIGLRNVKPENFVAVEKLIQSELEKVVKNGIEQKLLESVIAKIEFEFREQEGGGYPKGIALYMTILQSWLYGREPLEPLAIEKELAAIKKEIVDGSSYFVDLLNRSLLANTHRVVFRLSPEVKFQEKALAAEQKRLAELQKALPIDGMDRIKNETEIFAAYQKKEDSKEALATLPKLEVSSIDKEIRHIPTIEKNVSGIKILEHALTANGIVYVDFVFDISHLDSEQRSKLLLLGEYLFRLDTKSHKSEELALLLDLYAGGYGSNYFLQPRVDNQELVQKFIVSAKCLQQHVPRVIELIGEILTELDFSDSKKIIQILAEQKAEVEAALVHNGHGYAINYARATVSKAYSLTQEISGIRFIQNLKKWVNEYGSKPDDFAKSVNEVYQAIFSNREVLVNITTDDENLSEVEKLSTQMLKKLPSSQKMFKKEKPVASTSSRKTALLIPSQVSYQGYAIKLNGFDQVKKGNLLAIAKYVNMDYLWVNVRQLGGAYGSGVVFDFPNELVAFYSYRDPAIKKTYETFSDLGRTMEKTAGQLTKRDVDDCIIGAIAQLDYPLTVEEKGDTALQYYLTGMTDEYRQSIRDQLLTTSQSDFQNFAKYFRGLDQNHAGMATLASLELIEKENLRDLFDTIITV